MNILTDSLGYSFRGNGKYMLVIGAVLSVISTIASVAPIIGFFAYIFLAGYFTSTFFSIIQSTAVGDSEAPEFPDVSNILPDLIWPMIQVGFVFLFSFSPYMICALLGGDLDSTWALILLFLGVVYFPMAMLSVVVLGYMGAISPHIVIPGIYRSGWLYWLAVALLLLIRFLEMAIAGFLDHSIIMGSIIMAVVGMYVLMTNGRVLGLVYRSREEELGWL